MGGGDLFRDRQLKWGAAEISPASFCGS